MNHRTLTIAATIGLLAFTSCSAQQRQIVENLTGDPAPAEVVVDNDPTVVTPPPRNEATVTTYIIDIGTPAFPVINPNAPCGETGGGDCPQATIPCGETGAPDCYQPPSPPTTIYTGPPLMQCEDGSFAPQGQCPPPNEQMPPTTAP